MALTLTLALPQLALNHDLDLTPQAERALREAAEQGDLATLTHLVEEGVDLGVTDIVSAAPPAAPQPPSAPRPPPAPPAAPTTTLLPYL